MQAGRGQAVRAGHLERPDRVARLDPGSDPDLGHNRLVGRAQRAVDDHDDAQSGDPAGEADPSAPDRQHRLADPPGQVNATMTSLPVGVGRIERTDDGRSR